MRVMTHNDNAIRMIDAFKKYNQFMTEIIEDSDTFKTIRGVEGKMYCGTFTAKVYVGTRPMGTYKFDCRHWADVLTLSDREMKPRITKVK